MKIMKRTAAASEKRGRISRYSPREAKAAWAWERKGFSHSPPIRWRWSIRWGPVMFFTERSLLGSCRDIQQRKPPVLPAPYRQSNVRESEEGQGYRIGKLCVSSWKQAGLIIGKLKNGYSIINGAGPLDASDGSRHFSLPVCCLACSTAYSVKIRQNML